MIWILEEKQGDMQFWFDSDMQFCQNNIHNNTIAIKEIPPTLMKKFKK